MILEYSLLFLLLEKLIKRSRNARVMVPFFMEHRVLSETTTAKAKAKDKAKAKANYLASNATVPKDFIADCCCGYN